MEVVGLCAVEFSDSQFSIFLFNNVYFISQKNKHFCSGVLNFK